MFFTINRPGDWIAFTAIAVVYLDHWIYKIPWPSLWFPAIALGIGWVVNGWIIIRNRRK